MSERWCEKLSNELNNKDDDKTAGKSNNAT